MKKSVAAADQAKNAGLRLRAARLVLGHNTRDTFSAYIGVSSSALANWENGFRVPDVFAMVRMWEKTGITLEWVYAGSVRGLPYELADSIAAKAAELGAKAPTQVVSRTRTRKRPESPGAKPRHGRMETC